MEQYDIGNEAIEKVIHILELYDILSSYIVIKKQIETPASRKKF